MDAVPSSILSEAPSPANEAFGAGAKREMFGLLAPSTFGFAEYPLGDRILRSSAAASVDAVWINGSPDWDRSGEVQLIRRELILPCPFNPRHFVSREAMATLHNSVAAQGLHTPLDISQHPDDGKCFLLSGHRRLWVATALDLDLLPCKLDARGILSEVQMREAVIRYNEGQEKPAPIDRAQSLFEYIQASGMSQNAVAARFNMSPWEVSNSLRLLTLPLPVREKVNSGKIAVATGLEIARHTGGERAQIEIAERVVAEKLSTAVVHKLISRARSASSIQISRSHGPKQRNDEHRVKQHEFRISGAHPLTITVSSKKAELNPEQIREALTEVVMHIPVEMEVHHRTVATFDTPTVLTNPTLRISSDNGSASTADSPSARIELPTASIGGLRSGAAPSIRAAFTDGKPDWSQPTTIQLIHRDCLVPHPMNPRKLVSQAAMDDTLQSIRESGMHTPLHISQYSGDPSRAYVLGGHRRLWCAAQLNLDLLPCRLDSRGVLDDVQIREALFRDNEGQEKPAPVDRAQSFADYLNASGYSLERAARNLGVNPQTITRLMRLLELPPAVQELINMGQINESVGLAIADYQGGAAAQVALAYRAVEQGLTAKQVREFIGQNRISLAGLDLSDRREATSDKVWTTAGDRRIIVHLHSGTGGLSRTQTLQALQQALGQVGSMAGDNAEPAFPISTDSNNAAATGHKELPAAPAEKTDGLVRLSSFPARDPARFRAIAEKFLSKFITQGPHGPEVSQEVAQSLMREVNTEDLKRLELSELDTTVDNTRKWYGLPHAKGSPKVRLFEVLEFWGTSLQYIRDLPPSKQQFAWVEIERYPLDVNVSLSSIKRGRAAQEIRQRLERFPDALQLRLLTLVDAERLERSHRTVAETNNPTFTVAELEARGFKCHPHLRWFISNWLVDVEHQRLDPHRPKDAFTFSELHGYFSYAMRRFLENSGGNTKAMIGKLQLRRGHIAYSENITGTHANGFGWRSVFQELKTNLEILNTMFQERQAPLALGTGTVA